MIGVTSFVKNSPNDLIVQGCIDNLPAGNYTVYIYDVKNGTIPLTSILPAIILIDIIINDILLTTTSKLIIVITKLNTQCMISTVT